MDVVFIQEVLALGSGPLRFTVVAVIVFAVFKSFKTEIFTAVSNHLTKRERQLDKLKNFWSSDYLGQCEFKEVVSEELNNHVFYLTTQIDATECERSALVKFKKRLPTVTWNTIRLSFKERYLSLNDNGEMELTVSTLSRVGTFVSHALALLFFVTFVVFVFLTIMPWELTSLQRFTFGLQAMGSLVAIAGILGMGSGGRGALKLKVALDRLREKEGAEFQDKTTE